MVKREDKRANTCSGSVKDNPTNGIDEGVEEAQDDIMLQVVHRKLDLMPYLGMETPGGVNRFLERNNVTIPRMDVVDVKGNPIGWSDERFTEVLDAIRRQTGRLE